MKPSKINRKMLKFLSLAFFTILTAYFSSCSNDTTNPNYQTDEQWLQSIVIKGNGSVHGDDDNLMFNEKSDLDDSGAVPDNGNGPMSPIDSLKRWGRIIESVDLNLQGTFSGDTLYTILVTRTITGHYRIIGYKAGQIDSVNKPYTETLKRNVVFKRVERKANPIFNWRLYQISLLGGSTSEPQNGNSNTQLTQIQVNINNVPTYTWTGPDFTINKFTTRRFFGAGIPEVHTGDQVTILVTVNSTEQNNYVAWHWARNTFGFHRVPFTFVNAIPGGNGWIVTFQKNFVIYAGHPTGAFNGYISANTHESLWDDDINLFSSTEVGIPYRVLQ